MDLLVLRANARLKGLCVFYTILEAILLHVHHPLEDYDPYIPLREEEEDEVVEEGVEDDDVGSEVDVKVFPEFQVRTATCCYKINDVPGRQALGWDWQVWGGHGWCFGIFDTQWTPAACC